MKLRSKIIIYSLGAAFFAWSVDAVLEYLIFYKGNVSFADIFFLNMDTHDRYVRFFIVVSFLLYGFFVELYARKYHSIETEKDSFSKFPSENPNPVIRISKNGTILYANNGSRDILRFWRTNIGDKVSQELEETIRRAFHENRSITIEESVDDKIYSLRGVPLPEEGYINFYGFDITDRIAAEEEVRSLAKFPMQNPNPVLRIGDDINIIYVNKGCRDLLRSAGMEFNSFTEGANKDVIIRAVESGKLQTFEMDIGDRLFEFIAVPIPEQGYVNIYGIDITEREQAFSGLEELNARLEDMVKEKTRELTILNSQLESFNYSVSHELRAPLRSMNGFSERLMEQYSDDLPDEAVDMLKRIASSAINMGHIIDSLLRLSQMTRNKINVVDVNISELARTIISGIREREPDRKIEFVVHEGLTVRSDEGLLEVILGNLIDNACKFTASAEHPRVEIGAQEESYGGKIFFVKDNGCGFNMEYKDKLFLAFQRLHGAKDYPGIGIGLATVKRIIDLHGGTIWAESEEGKGAIFCFQLDNRTKRSQK